MVPESPRFLISRDREDEAFAILAKYHAEGDSESLLVKAEMAQIKSTIKIELDNSKQSWLEMVRTSGMRRRVLIAAFMGLFTQMSGNTLLSYYQNILYEMMGYTSTYAKTRINLANACWSLIVSCIAAYIVTVFRRRPMFMLSSASMLTVFASMTIAFERLSVAKKLKRKNKSAGIAALFFYFAYAPCYSLGNNALTYSKFFSNQFERLLTALAYLIELFPYAQRTRGIGIEQIFGKAGGFFSQNVNPIAMTAIGWKFFAIYCGWIAFEFTFIFFLYPETSGRTLEELAFCRS